MNHELHATPESITPGTHQVADAVEALVSRLSGGIPATSPFDMEWHGSRDGGQYVTVHSDPDDEVGTEFIVRIERLVSPMTDTREIDRLRSENAELKTFLDDATGRFSESDHLVPKWAKALRTERRRVEQLRSDVAAWQERALVAERAIARKRLDQEKKP